MWALGAALRLRLWGGEGFGWWQRGSAGQWGNISTRSPIGRCAPNPTAGRSSAIGTAGSEPIAGGGCAAAPYVTLKGGHKVKPPCRGIRSASQQRASAPTCSTGRLTPGSSFSRPVSRSGAAQPRRPPQLPPHSPPKASRAPQAAQSRSRAVRATSRQALPREPRRETETTHGVGGGGGEGKRSGSRAGGAAAKQPQRSGSSTAPADPLSFCPTSPSVPRAEQSRDTAPLPSGGAMGEQPGQRIAASA